MTVMDSWVCMHNGVAMEANRICMKSISELLFLTAVPFMFVAQMVHDCLKRHLSTAKAKLLSGYTCS